MERENNIIDVEDSFEADEILFSELDDNAQAELETLREFNY